MKSDTITRIRVDLRNIFNYNNRKRFAKVMIEGEMMAVCTFFGHHDCPDTIGKALREVIVDLIENHEVNMFYVGQQGAFDSLVRNVLKDLVSVYPDVSYAVVLERLPTCKAEFDTRDYSDTMLPEGIENVHPRFAISWRNKWMLKQSDYVVTYITHSWGGAAQFGEKAIKQGKTVYNLAQHP